MRVDLTYTIRGDVPADYFTLTDSEAIASYVFYALNSLDINGNVAQDNDSIYMIPEISGKEGMAYKGDTGVNGKPTLTRRPPIYSNKEIGSISFDNEPYTWFDQTWLETIPFPYEVSFVMIFQQGTSNEAFTNRANMYIGESGGRIRIMHAGTILPEGTKGPKQFHYSQVHVLFELTQGTVWVDGELQGTIEYEALFSTGTNGHQIGVNTNSAQWEFISTHVFPRALTTNERNQFFADSVTKFRVGQEKQLPYARDISFTKTGSTLTANYTYRNPLGFPEDTTKTVYRWVYLDEGFLYDQKVIDGQGKSISTDLITTITEGNVKCEVQVFDTEGNTWKRIAGAFQWTTGL